MTQFSLLVPIIVSSIFSALMVEHTGRRIFFAISGTVLLSVGNFMFIHSEGYDPSEITQVKPIFIKFQRAFWPAIIGSLGAGIYAPVLLQSISQMAINSIQGVAFGFALSIINSTEIIWFAIQDVILVPSVLDASQQPQISLISGKFPLAVKYLH